MNIAVAGDHAGFELKNYLIADLRKQGHEILDLGAHEYNPHDDYPDFARAVAQAVASGQAERGVIICGSGVGTCVAANKVPGIRACPCHDTYSAHQGVEHDNMNILCLGARVVGVELATELVTTFLKARFSGGERHCRRLEKVLAIERQALQGHEKQGNEEQP